MVLHSDQVVGWAVALGETRRNGRPAVGWPCQRRCFPAALGKSIDIRRWRLVAAVAGTCMLRKRFALCPSPHPAMVVKKFGIGMTVEAEGLVGIVLDVATGVILFERAVIEDDLPGSEAGYAMAAVVKMFAVDEEILRIEAPAVMGVVSGHQGRSWWVESPWHRWTAPDRACQNSRGPCLPDMYAGLRHWRGRARRISG